MCAQSREPNVGSYCTGFKATLFKIITAARIRGSKFNPTPDCETHQESTPLDIAKATSSHYVTFVPVSCLGVAKLQQRAGCMRNQQIGYSQSLYKSLQRSWIIRSKFA